MTSIDLVCSYYTIAGTAPRTQEPSPRPLADRARACADAGFTGIGVHFRDYLGMQHTGTSDAEMRATLADHGMRHVEVEFLLNWFADGEPGVIARQDERSMFQAAEALDARLIFLTGTLDADQTVPRDQLIERFAALGARAAEHGLTIGVEPCAWSDINSVETATALIRDAGVTNAGLYLDLWHLYRRHVSWASLRDIPAELVVGVQLDDADPAVVHDLPHDSLHERLAPGEGAADAVGFIAALLDIGVTVPISVELISDLQRSRPLDEAARIAGSSARQVVDTALERVRPTTPE